MELAVKMDAVNLVQHALVAVLMDVRIIVLDVHQLVKVDVEIHADETVLAVVEQHVLVVVMVVLMTVQVIVLLNALEDAEIDVIVLVKEIVT